MPYRYREDIATADAAFEAWDATPEGMFATAAQATLGVMVADPEALAPREHRTFSLRADDLEMLLFEFLQEILFYKDAEQLLLRPGALNIEIESGGCRLQAEMHGEAIQPQRQELLVDVKAVTLHRFAAAWRDGAWRAFVILDI
ncbi:MAG: archease [Sedimentisphaerales bacterium]|nr:archease [Sedimentisphaerales bacterium]